MDAEAVSDEALLSKLEASGEARAARSGLQPGGEMENGEAGYVFAGLAVELGLDCVRTVFAGADAHDVIDR